jgi:preprotein translocase subunit SecA
LLVQISYGKSTFFDRRTHQRKSVIVARLSYPYYVAGYIRDQDSESLLEQVMAHLDAASALMREEIGANALNQISGSDLIQLESSLQEKLKASIERLDEDYAGIGPIGTLPDEVQAQIRKALGSIGISEGYRRLLLGVGDRLWVEYLTEMEALRTSIGLEAYGQRDPLVQYKSRAVDLFRQLLASIRAGVVSRMYGVQPRVSQPVATAPVQQQEAAQPASASEGDGAKSKSKRRRRRRRKKK